MDETKLSKAEGAHGRMFGFLENVPCDQRFAGDSV
jgi:hypothetical protein